MTSINTYVWDAKKYEEGSFIHRYYVHKILQGYQFNNHSVILDIGCGDGGITAQIAENFPHSQIIGMDRSENMVTYALQKYSCVQNLKFKVQNALEINEQNTFNYIVSFFCLHWILDQAEMLKRVNQALQAKGKILFILPSKDESDDVTTVVFETVRKPQWQAYTKDYQSNVQFYSDEEYRELLKMADFKIDLIETICDPVLLPNIDVFRKFIEPLPIFYQCYPVEIIPQLIEDVINNFKVLCKRKYQGKLMVDLGIQVVKAHKS